MVTEEFGQNHLVISTGDPEEIYRLTMFLATRFGEAVSATGVCKVIVSFIREDLTNATASGKFKGGEGDRAETQDISPQDERFYQSTLLPFEG